MNTYPNKIREQLSPLQVLKMPRTPHSRVTIVHPQFPTLSPNIPIFKISKSFYLIPSSNFQLLSSTRPTFTTTNVNTSTCFIQRLRMEEDEGCTTPKRRIPAAVVCPPPPPRKKPMTGNKRDPPKNGFFHSPDLDALFAMPVIRQTCA